MSKTQAVKYWVTSAMRDRQTAIDLVKSKHYNWSLFVWHLVLERTIKAIITQQDQSVPPIHNLVRLAQTARLELTPEQQDQLNEITGFNLEARYDDYKQAFYRKATKAYASKWSKICEEIFQWLKNHI